MLHPSATAASRPSGSVVPRYMDAIAMRSTSSCPSRRTGRVRYGDATEITATITATRTAGNATEASPTRVTTSSACIRLEFSTTMVPMSRASTHAATPPIAMSRASRQRRATTAAATTSASAHRAPTA